MVKERYEGDTCRFTAAPWGTFGGAKGAKRGRATNSQRHAWSEEGAERVQRGCKEGAEREQRGCEEGATMVKNRFRKYHK